MILHPGRPTPEGATVGADGTNFALYAPQAQRVELCLFADGGERRFDLRRSGGIWHGLLPGLPAGTHYGYRVHGECDQARGLLFNPQKLLLDPYARAVTGKPDFSTAEAAARFYWQNEEDNAAYAPKSQTVAEAPFDWADDVPPRTPWAQTVIYEVHVKGFSRKNPRIPAAVAGTFAGMAHPESVRHLKRLGISAVELLPVAYSISEAHLQQRGLKNYWGYNIAAHNALNPELAADPAHAAAEFKNLVRTLHHVGIEVILDVVYNHTAEGGRKDAMLCQRGIANPDYYHLTPHGSEENWSGCGNAVNAAHPHTLQWILDSLRYWVQEYHIDGFRFDLGSILGRMPEFRADAPFFQAVAQDPVLREVKMIAEPWDIGWGGYQVGHFPAPFAQWNDRFRDDIRRFFCRRSRDKGAFARRLAGSDDFFPQALCSINFITAHDGFTLQDLVSYDRKHNLANGENNRDGHGDNLSNNHGAEGASDNADVLNARAQTRRALLGALLLSHGVPMLTAGDEIAHSQSGNNNAYCQDNDTAYLDWENADHELCAYTARLIALRREIAATGKNSAWTADDVQWLTTDGSAMRESDWHDGNPAMQVLLNGEFLLLINPERDPRDFILPAGGWQRRDIEAHDSIKNHFHTTDSFCLLRRIPPSNPGVQHVKV